LLAIVVTDENGSGRRTVFSYEANHTQGIIMFERIRKYLKPARAEKSPGAALEISAEEQDQQDFNKLCLAIIRRVPQEVDQLERVDRLDRGKASAASLGDPTHIGR
jgi:hypothetical protein